MSGTVSAREAAPEPLKRIGRRAYVWVGAATSSLRCEPGFILVGASRCGTTSLFRALMEHPQIARPTFYKGINYFDLNYYRGMRWYRGHFPVTEIARRKAAGYGEMVAFEASGYYLYHPFALERASRDLPSVKLIAMLRDPAERAFSAYKHEYARDFERETFERAVELEDERLAGEIDRMRDDPTYESFSHRHHSYLHRGHYAEQLERGFNFFPQSQWHIIDSKTYFDNPAVEYRRLLAFLGLDAFEPHFGQHNARPSKPMPPQMLHALQDYYAPHDKRLTELLERPFSWINQEDDA